MAALSDTYRVMLDAGDLHPDPEHADIVDRLARLQGLLKDYVPGGQKGWFRPKSSAAPRGFYFYGDVGRGKTMLMDLFFEHAPVKKKRRVHFHSFMMEVHDTLHKLRADAKGTGVDAALDKISDSLSKDAWLLCFDEFFVDDVADAMILARLFTGLFRRGVVVVATSNCAPEDLYKDGLQRDRFEPFIDLLYKHLEVVRFFGGRDYRQDRLRDMQVYHWPADGKSHQKADEVFAALTGGAEPQKIELKTRGRSFPVPAAAKCVARFCFADLCEQPRSAADYLELARHFHTLIVEGVPKMTDDQRNEALRFITLIDVLYEHRIKLFVTAAAPPEDLYTGKHHARAFRRTVSRLVEMQAKDYLGAV